MTVSARRSALFFRARDRICALPLDSVLECLRPLPVTALAAAPDFVLGAALVRGMPTPVLDAGMLSGARDAGRPGRFILLRAAAHPVALAVEAVLGIRDLVRAAPSARDISRITIARVQTQSRAAN